MFSSCWRSGNQAQWSPRDGKQMSWAPYDFPVYCLKRVWRPWPREGELRLSPKDSLMWGDGAENPGKPRWLEFAGYTPREERAA